MASRRTVPPRVYLGPTDFEVFGGLPVPDPITFVVSPLWLNRPNLYPRQATLLKVIFLREDLFTEYDYDVVQEWEVSFRQSGENGITPDILERMRYLKTAGYSHFREVLLIMGRRGGKGYVSALAMAYVLWLYMSKGDTQGHYGVDRDKQLACYIYAGKKEQARENLWKDLKNVVIGAPCFEKYISRPMGESFSIYAPHDFVRKMKQERRGIHTQMDIATFTIQPKESTLTSGRGPASFMQGYDEMAHLVAATGASRSAEEIYGAATPALDQFKQDAFIVEPSSPWQMTGQFYQNWLNSLLIENGKPVYPEMMMLQLTSWEIYLDWQEAHLLPIFPEGFTGDLGEYANNSLPVLPKLKVAIQEYDESMQRLERSNPETFAVERRCLDPDTKVLTADLRWVRIDDLEVGDELISIDENGVVPTEGGKRRERTLQLARVEAKVDSFDQAYKIEFNDGTSVVCSGKHRWLSGSVGSQRCQNWRSIEPQAKWGPRTVMKPGDTIRALVEPWEEDRSWEAGWLAGMYDGEGCITNRTRRRGEFCIALTQNPGTVLSEAWRILEEKGFAPKDGSSKSRNAQVIKVTGLSKCLRLLGQLRPFRLLERGNPDMWINRALGHENGARYSKTIKSITPVGQQRLVDIQTSTGTFIAEGLVSHNSHWQAVVDAYLNRAKIAEMFAPWNGRTLTMQTTGLLTNFYKGHADPSLVNANFGLAIAHGETDEHGVKHCIFDYIYHYEPSYWDDNIVDYIQIGDDIWKLIEGFKPDEFTYDQWNSAEAIQRINKKIREANFPKRVLAYKIDATVKHNWERAETFKVALNMGWIHAPAYEQAELELRYLQLKNGKVEKQDTGPIQTKDVADCLMECTWTILGEQVRQWTHGELSQLALSGSVQGGFDPHSREYEAPVLGQELAGLGRRATGRTAAIRGGGLNPARNPLAGAGRRGSLRRR